MLTMASLLNCTHGGLLAGTYLGEYGRSSRFANFTRDLSDIMMSAPSVIVGVFVYGILVMPIGPSLVGQGVLLLANK